MSYFTDVTEGGEPRFPIPRRLPQRLFRSEKRAGVAQFAQGTSTAADTLAALRVSQSLLVEIGLDQAYSVFQVALDVHNRLMADMLADLCAVTTDRQRRYGTYDTITMEELDSFGVPGAQKVTGGSIVGFPLRKYAAALQWNWDYLRTATGQEFAGQIDALFTADKRLVQREIRRAIFYGSNPSVVYDALTDNGPIYPRRLKNGDSAGLPIGPNGETFATAHTHYHNAGRGNGDTIADQATPTAWATASAAQKLQDIRNLTRDVREHFAEGELIIAINAQQESDFYTLTGFAPLYDPRTSPIQISSASPAAIGRGDLDILNTFNRLIGYIEGAAVYVKPWVPTNYILAYIRGGMVETPLCVRVPVAPVTSPNMPMGTGVGPGIIQGGTVSGLGDLTIVSEMAAYPLQARIAERRIGVAAWNRVGAAVLHTASNSATYVTPTIN